jgi:bifunctional DNA-binding transcriptional regulator/antitoxin component of YhaV-PrlF toxin-antitoxin module
MGGEEEFNKVVNEYRARVGTDEDSKIKFKVNDEDEKLLIEFPLETEIVHKVNENTCKFVGKFVEKNLEQLEGLGDKKEFKNFMNKMYSLGRSIAMYQNPEDVKLDDRDRNDMHNFIEGKIKDLITLSNKNGFVWPDEFDWTLLIGESSDSPIPNTYKFK